MFQALFWTVYNQLHDRISSIYEKVKQRTTSLDSIRDAKIYVDKAYLFIYPMVNNQVQDIEDTTHNKKTSLRRITWVVFLTVYLWFILVLCGYVAYYDDPVVYSRWGSPYYMLGKQGRVITQFFMGFILIPAIMKIVCPIVEQKSG